MLSIARKVKIFKYTLRKRSEILEPSRTIKKRINFFEKQERQKLLVLSKRSRKLAEKALNNS